MLLLFKVTVPDFDESHIIHEKCVKKRWNDIWDGGTAFRRHFRVIHFGGPAKWANELVMLTHKMNLILVCAKPFTFALIHSRKRVRTHFSWHFLCSMANSSAEYEGVSHVSATVLSWTCQTFNTFNMLNGNKWHYTLNTWLCVVRSFDYSKPPSSTAVVVVSLFIPLTKLSVSDARFGHRIIPNSIEKARNDKNEITTAVLDNKGATKEEEEERLN